MHEAMLIAFVNTVMSAVTERLFCNFLVEGL